MSSFVEWFESVCLEMNTNPLEATKNILQFRDSENALETIQSLLQTPSGSITPMAQFQAVLVLQYSSLKEWNNLSITSKSDIITILWTLIQSSFVSGTMPSFALNKIMQVYGMLWKRKWNDIDINEKQIFLQQISAFLEHAEAFNFGVKLLRIVIEEFNSRSSAEIGLPIEFHRVLRKSYESYGIDDAFNLSIKCINHSFAQALTLTSTNPISQILNITSTIKESSKLLLELLNWDFHNDELFILQCPGQKEKENNIINHYLSIPRKWSPELLQAKFINDLYTSYNILYTILSENTTTTNTSFSSNNNNDELINLTNTIQLCLDELRLLMIAISSIKGKFFDNDTEKQNLCDLIIKLTSPLLDRCVNSHNDQTSNISKLYNSFPDLKAREYDMYGTIMIRLLNNFGLIIISPLGCFEGFMHIVCKSLFQISTEITVIANTQLGLLCNNSEIDSDDSNLLEGWRGDALVLFLDILCCILDDELMLPQILRGGGDDGIVINPQIKEGIKTMTLDLFYQLFECILKTTLFETIYTKEEEEDEDNANIQSRSMDDLISSIATIGRINFCSCLKYISNKIQLTLGESQKLLSLPTHNPNSYIENLEILRISTLFSSHLCNDCYDSDVNKKSILETPVIPSMILDNCSIVGESCITVFNENINNVSQILQLQLFLLSVADHRQYLLSPYLIQTTFMYLTQYFHRFVDTDCDGDKQLYNIELKRLIPFVFNIHDENFNASIGFFITSCQQFLEKFPQENEVIESISQLIIAISKSSSIRRKDYLLSIPALSPIFLQVTGKTDSTKLNSSGTKCVFNSLCNFSLFTKCETMFVQLCTIIHEQIEIISKFTEDSIKTNAEASMVLIEQTIACMRGIATSPPGLDHLIHSLFDLSLPVLSWCIQTHALNYDHITKLFLLLLRDYSEVQISKLSQQSCLNLYRATWTSLQISAFRLNQTLPPASVELKIQEEEYYRNDIVLHVLQLLNKLGVKDFFTDESIQEVPNNLSPIISPADFSLEIANILLYGLENIVNFVTSDLLRSYPSTCESYFSFINEMTSSYEKEFAMKINTTTTSGDALLNTIIQHLLWGSGAIDSLAAKDALQSLRSLALFQANSQVRGTQGLISVNNQDAFAIAMNRLLQMVLFSTTCEYGISSDNIDACGHALLTLILLDIPRFEAYAKELITQQQVQFQELLLNSFGKLTNINGTLLSLSDLKDTRKKQLFIINFRNFVLEVKSLVLYN